MTEIVTVDPVLIFLRLPAEVCVTRISDSGLMYYNWAVLLSGVEIGRRDVMSSKPPKSRKAALAQAKRFARVYCERRLASVHKHG